jgi:hypothetical protein
MDPTTPQPDYRARMLPSRPTTLLRRLLCLGPLFLRGWVMVEETEQREERRAAQRTGR